MNKSQKSDAPTETAAVASRKNQQGFILLTVLAFMIVLTVIVLSTVNVSGSDEKIARNSRDKDIAFAAAEAAVRDAEIYISGGYQFPYSPNNNPISYPNQLTLPDQSDFFNAGDANYAYTSQIGNITQSPLIAGVSAQPRYLIDIVRVATPNSICNNAPFVFRITAQGEGRSANTRATLQELYCPP